MYLLWGCWVYPNWFPSVMVWWSVQRFYWCLLSEYRQAPWSSRDDKTHYQGLQLHSFFPFHHTYLEWGMWLNYIQNTHFLLVMLIIVFQHLLSMINYVHSWQAKECPCMSLHILHFHHLTEVWIGFCQLAHWFAEGNNAIILMIVAYSG